LRGQGGGRGLDASPCWGAARQQAPTSTFYRRGASVLLASSIKQSDWLGLTSRRRRRQWDTHQRPIRLVFEGILRRPPGRGVAKQQRRPHNMGFPGERSISCVQTTRSRCQRDTRRVSMGGGSRAHRAHTAVVTEGSSIDRAGDMLIHLGRYHVLESDFKAGAQSAPGIPLVRNKWVPVPIATWWGTGG
jgi:hypothetical protein